MMPAQPAGYGEPVAVPAEQNAPAEPEPVAQAAEPAAAPTGAVEPVTLPEVGQVRFYTRFDPLASPARDRTYAVLVVGHETQTDGSVRVRAITLGDTEASGAFLPDELS
jgi:hypothetical protein